MAEPILVTGKRISDMELVTVVVGTEKIPTGQAGDLAITPNQIADHTIARGDLASQEDLSQVEVSLGTQITNLENDVASADNSIRGLIAAEEGARIAADDLLQTSLGGEVAARIAADESLQASLSEEVEARIAADDLKVDKEGSVSSVAGRVGDVSLVPSDVLVEGFGSQEGVNKYVPKPFLSGYTYGLDERVVLDNGDIVRSVVAGNAVDPNADLTGWVKENSASQIFGVDGVSVEDKLDLNPIVLRANGISDDIQLIQAVDEAKTTGKEIIGYGDFKLSQTHNLREVCVDFENSTIEVTTAADMLIVGWNSSATSAKPQKFGRVFRRTASTTVPTVRYMGSKNHFFYMQNCDFMELYADSTNAAQDGSIAYCTFHLGHVRILHFWTNPDNTAAGAGNGGQIQWINENAFYIQRFSFFKSDGTYEHNHNRFYGGSFENAAAKIEIIKGWDNYFYSLRMEGTPTIILGPTTERNVVINTWDSSYSQPVGTANVIDNGFNNIVVDDFSLYNSKQVLAYTDLSTIRLNTAVSNQTESSLQRIVGKNSNSILLETGFVEADKDDWFRFATKDNTGSQTGANSRYRARISFYDSKMQPVAANGDFIKDTGGTFSVVTSNTIQAGTNVFGGMLCITKEAIAAGVRFVKLAWSSNSPITSSISNAVSLSIFKFSPKSNLFVGGFNQNPSRQIIVTAKPTQGFAPAGTGVVTQDGTTRFTNVFDFETTLSALSGTSLTVSSAAGVQVGDVVGVNKDDLSTFWSSVSAVSGNVITLADSLSDASVGARVVFNRWL